MVDGNEFLAFGCREDVFSHEAIGEGLGDVVGAGGRGGVVCEVEAQDEWLRAWTGPAVGANNGVGVEGAEGDGVDTAEGGGGRGKGGVRSPGLRRCALAFGL